MDSGPGTGRQIDSVYGRYTGRIGAYASKGTRIDKTQAAAGVQLSGNFAGGMAHRINVHEAVTPVPEIAGGDAPVRRRFQAGAAEVPLRPPEFHRQRGHGLDPSVAETIDIRPVAGIRLTTTGLIHDKQEIAIGGKLITEHSHGMAAGDFFD